MGEPAASVALLIVGQSLRHFYPAEGWANLEQNMLVPLSAVNTTVRSFVCTDLGEPRLSGQAGARIRLAHQFHFAVKATGNPNHADQFKQAE